MVRRPPRSTRTDTLFPYTTLFRHYLRFAFAAEPVRHDPVRPLDDGIMRALWMTLAELQAENDRHRSPLVWRVVADFLSGQRHPLSGSAERRVGKECGSTCRSRGSPYIKKKNTNIQKQHKD